MRAALIDTNIFSAFMRGDEKVIRKVQHYLREHDTLTISVITYYEIMRGIKALSNQKKIASCHELMALCHIQDLDSLIALNASEIYDDLRKKGQLIEDADILIAATARVYEMGMVTDNTRHFDRIEGLKVENWLAS